MKKRYIILIAFMVLILATWIACRITGAIQLYNVATPANYPSLIQGDHFLTSNLVSPKLFDFICYQVDSSAFNGEVWIHRLCGMEGDKVEIIAGDLFVNGRNVDSGLSLAHIHWVSKNEIANLSGRFELDDDNIILETADSLMLFLNTKDIRKHKLKTIRVLKEKGVADDEIKLVFANEWNIDYFGPIVIPKNKFFVLGDNRNNSLDSRYKGLIDRSNIESTLIYK